MAFIVETGSGVAGATSYAAVATFKAACDDVGFSYAGKSDADIQQALVRTTRYIDGAFRTMFPGFRANTRLQALEWPRAGAVDREGVGIDGTTIPVEIVAATIEGAKRELASPNSLAPDVKAGGGVLKRIKTGSTELEYDTDHTKTATFQAVEQALGSLLIVRSAYSGMSVRG